jgi:hypothetical protein
MKSHEHAQGFPLITVWINRIAFALIVSGEMLVQHV